MSAAVRTLPGKSLYPIYRVSQGLLASNLPEHLATGVGHLRLFESARQALIYAAPHVGFAVAADQDQFLSTARIRALRKLWAKIQQECSIPH